MGIPELIIRFMFMFYVFIRILQWHLSITTNYRTQTHLVVNRIWSAPKMLLFAKATQAFRFGLRKYRLRLQCSGWRQKFWVGKSVEYTFVVDSQF